MANIHLLGLVFAFVCFALAAWRLDDPMWKRLIAVGLAFLVASMFL